MPHDWPVMLGEFVGRRGVSLERLQSFCRVAEAGGVMAAAQGDPNRQSLFSRQIRELEAALQVELLDRSEVPHRLTAAGMRFEQLARGFLTGVDRFLAESSEGPTLVVIGAGESTIQWLIIPMLHRLLSPSRRIRFRNLTSREAVEGVRSHRVDLAIVPREDAVGDLSSQRLASYGMIAVGQAQAIEALRDSATLRGHPVAILEGSNRLRAAIDDLCSHGGSPEIRLECTSYPQILEACAVEELIGLVPELASASARDLGLATFAPPELEHLQVDLALVWSNSSADARREIGELVELLTRPASDSAKRRGHP